MPSIDLSMFSLKNEPQDAVTLLENGHSLYLSTFWQTLPYGVLATLCMATPRLLLYVPSLNPTNTHHSIWTVMMIFYGLALWILSACVIRLNSLCHQNPLRLTQSFRIASLKWLPLLLLMAIYSIGILSSTMLLIIPAIFLLYALSFAFLLLLAHNQPITQALLMSARLVQGHWWHTFVVLTTPLLCFTTTLLALFYIEIRLRPLNAVGCYKLLFQIPSLILEIWFVPFIISVALVLLHDLRSRHHANRPPWS